MDKIFKYIVVVLIGAFTTASISFAEEFFPPTASQEHFTHVVHGLPGVVDIKWKSPISMWVKVSSKAVGYPPRPDKASRLANILAERGRTALYQPFCVHIYVKSDNEIGRDCVF